MISKYFETDDLSPENEIFVDDLNAHDYYYEACYNDEEELQFILAFDKQVHFSTIYLVDNKNDIKDVLLKHRSRNFLTRVKIVLPKEKHNDQITQLCYFFTISLEFNFAIRYYINEKGYSYKEETLDENNIVKGTQRFYFSADGEIIYAFEYNTSGKLFNCVSFEDGRSINFDEISDIENKEQYLNA